MRPRSKKHFEERYARVSSLLVPDPAQFRGQWRSAFLSTGTDPDLNMGTDPVFKTEAPIFDTGSVPLSVPGSVPVSKRELHLEIGCGKGAFVAGMAKQRPDVDFLALEVVPTVIMMAMEKVFDDPVLAQQQNVRFIEGDARELTKCFADNEIDTIYLNFSDPWPRKKQFKNRLTHEALLAEYRRILRPGGVIRQKTDNQGLFEFSVDGYRAAGFEVTVLDEAPADNIMTEYERRFTEASLPIYRAVAVNKKGAD